MASGRGVVGGEQGGGIEEQVERGEERECVWRRVRKEGSGA